MHGFKTLRDKSVSDLAVAAWFEKKTYTVFFLNMSLCSGQKKTAPL